MPTGIQQFQARAQKDACGSLDRKSAPAFVVFAGTLLLSGCVASVAPEPEKQVSKAKTFEEVKKAPINDKTKFSSKDFWQDSIFGQVIIFGRYVFYVAFYAGSRPPR